jgi:hypothetical protein
VSGQVIGESWKLVLVANQLSLFDFQPDTTELECSRAVANKEDVKLCFTGFHASQPGARGGTGDCAVVVRTVASERLGAIGLM